MPLGHEHFMRLERLIELAGWGDRLILATSVLPDECLKVRREWEARSAKA